MLVLYLNSIVICGFSFTALSMYAIAPVMDASWLGNASMLVPGWDPRHQAHGASTPQECAAHCDQRTDCAAYQFNQWQAYWNSTSSCSWCCFLIQAPPAATLPLRPATKGIDTGIKVMGGECPSLSLFACDLVLSRHSGCGESSCDGQLRA